MRACILNKQLALVSSDRNSAEPAGLMSEPYIGARVTMSDGSLEIGTRVRNNYLMCFLIRSSKVTNWIFQQILKSFPLASSSHFISSFDCPSPLFQLSVLSIVPTYILSPFVCLFVCFIFVVSFLLFVCLADFLHLSLSLSIAVLWTFVLLRTTKGSMSVCPSPLAKVCLHQLFCHLLKKSSGNPYLKIPNFWLRMPL